MSKENFNQLVADANTAFTNGCFDQALKLAKAAIKLEPGRDEGYLTAGKACMSLSDAESAVKYFEKLVNMNKEDGNAYFLLGYALASLGKSVDSLKKLTQAIENNCSDNIKGQIYKMMAMMNIGVNDYKNALANLEQAQEYTGLDYEICQYQATCHMSLSDYKSTIAVINQMKLLQPVKYNAYSIAFHIFMDLSLYDDAKAELDKAEKFAEKNLDYYNDCMLYTLMNNPQNDTPETLPLRFENTLNALQKALDFGKPSVEQVFEMYLRAAELHLARNDPDSAIMCLDASDDPVESYNNRFSAAHPLKHFGTSDSNSDEYAILSEQEEEAMMDARMKNLDTDALNDYIDYMVNTQPVYDSEEGVAAIINEYLTSAENLPEPDDKKTEDYKLEGEYEVDQMHRDLKCTFYITAYEQKKDYESMLRKSRELQSSNVKASQYNGIYYELKTEKYLNTPNWQKKYRDRINFWTRKMLEDPSDVVSANYRVRCYIDIGDFDEAERLCEYLPADIKQALMEEIAKEKGGSA